MKLLIVSPHRDDAAFSIPLAMHDWAQAGHTISLVNLFTQSGYAPYASLFGLSAPARKLAVTVLRKQEDENFLAMFAGARSVDFGLEDAPLRLGCAVTDLCDRPVSSQDAACAFVRSALKILLHAPDVALVLPLALGGHVDHATAREAALPCATSVPCAFYEDVPYAMRGSAPADLNRVCAHMGMPLYPILCGATHPQPVAWRQQAALCYPSQIRADEAMAIACFCERYNYAERLWVNEHWIQATHSGGLSVNVKSIHEDVNHEPFSA